MNTLRKFYTLIFASVLAFGLNACSDDKDDDPQGDNSIIGVWETFIPEEGTDNGYYLELTFNQDGKCQQRNYGNVYNETIKGTWTTEGDTLNIYTVDDDTPEVATFKYTIANNTLSLYIYEDGQLEANIRLQRKS